MKSEFSREELVALAHLDLENSNIEAALTKVKQVLAGKDVPAEAYAIAGKIYAQLRIFDTAIAMLEKYLDVAPDATLERFQLGMAQFDSGNLDEASKVWDKVLKQSPDFPPARFYSALVLAEQGQTEKASTELNNLLGVVPRDNLYVQKAKDLLTQIASNGSGGAVKARRGGNG